MKKFLATLSLSTMVSASPLATTSCAMFSPLTLNNGVKKEAITTALSLNLGLFDSKKGTVARNSKKVDIIKGELAVSNPALFALFKQTSGKDAGKKIEDLIKNHEKGGVYYFSIFATKGFKHVKLSCFKLTIKFDKNNKPQFKSTEKYARLVAVPKIKL